MPLEEQKWDYFIKQIYSGNCCLLLGPSLQCLTDDAGNPITVLDAFSAFLKDRLLAKETTGYEDAKDFYYRANHYRAVKYESDTLNFHEDIREFERQRLSDIPQIYRDLSGLPFKTICNLVPDDFFARAMRDRGFYFVDEYYDFSKSKHEMKSLDEDTQLLYAIYGSFRSPGSVPVNHKDQVDMIKKLVKGEPPVPDSVLSRVKRQQSSFLFLGFDFNDWHYRLTMDCLGIPKPKIAYFPESGQQVALVSKAYFKGNYGIDFLDASTEAFVSKMMDRYVKAYGPADKEFRLVIDYDPAQDIYFKTFFSQLKTACSDRKFTYHYPNSMQIGSRQTLEQLLEISEVYIALISGEFLANQDNLARLRAALANPAIYTIVIVTDYVTYKHWLSESRGKLLVLPPNDLVLSDALHDNRLSARCNDLANTINSIIR